MERSIAGAADSLLTADDEAHRLARAQREGELYDMFDGEVPIRVEFREIAANGAWWLYVTDCWQNVAHRRRQRRAPPLRREARARSRARRAHRVSKPLKTAAGDSGDPEPEPEPPGRRGPSSGAVSW